MNNKDYTFLVVEDHATMSRMLVGLLGRFGYHSVVTVKDGKEAWEAVQRNEPSVDIILSDLLMPNLDGMQLLHLIRRSRSHWHLPFIMITGVDDAEKVLSVTEEHIDDYLVKPITEKMLRQKIHSALKKVYDPGPYHRALYEGRNHLHKGCYSLALEALEEARSLQPGQSAPYYFMARVQEQTGKLRDAEKNYKRCRDCSELYVKSLDGLARIYLHNKEYVKAVHVLKKGTEISPGNPNRHLDLSRALAYLKQMKEARNSLEVALDLTKKEKKLPSRFIEPCLNCGMEKMAEEIMQQNLGPETDEIVMLNHMGIVCRKRKEYELSRTYYERALKISPSNDLVNYNYALLLAELKEYSLARAYLRRILKLNPDFKNAGILMARFDELGV